MKVILQSLRMLAVFTLLTGVLYPLAVTAIARVAFPQQADGSLIVREGKVIGSALLAQKGESVRYFQPRPSGADYATIPSGASNKGPTSADLVKAIEERCTHLGPGAPADLLTASASGLDPDISPEAALFQVDRVAEARGISRDKIAALVAARVAGPQFGLLGEPRVNVLILNLALDELR